MTAVWIYLIFLLTYGGMVAGRLPWLRVDRTGIALVGLIALLATAMTLDEIGARIDMPTLLLLFALMIISAQFVASGFVDAVFEWIGAGTGGPVRMLALTVACAGGLAAFLANDILVYVATPLLVDAVRARGLDPRPYLIAFITASNAGSAATIIGAPQTIVIGQLGQLRLPTYLLACGVPAIMALLIVFVVVALAWHGSFELPPDDPGEGPPPSLAFGLFTRRQSERREHDRWQTNKGILALAALLALFCTDLPKDVFGLPIAALLLLNRRYSSRELIAGVDWPLLVLVACLFGVTGALTATALPGLALDWVQHAGLLPDNLLLMAPLTLLMACTIGNMPGIILFLQVWQDAPSGALYGLALLSSLAGNLLLIASLSNIIIVERAAERGVRLHAGEFARIGIPVTLLSIGFAMAWLYITGFMPILPAPVE